MTKHQTSRRAGTRALTAALTISVAVSLAACGGGADADADGTGDGEQGTATAPADAFTISSALAELPDDRQWQVVGVADLTGAVEATGLEVSPEDLTWRSVVGGLPLEDPQDTTQEELTYAPVFVALPQLLDRAIQSTATGDLPETLGWSPLDTETFAYLVGGSTGTTEFIVAGGPFPEDSLTALTDLGDGVWSLGDGADGELSPGSESQALDAIGRPVRMAQDDDQIALSTATEPVLAWAGGQPTSTAADRPELAEPAEALDEASTMTALFTGARRFDPIRMGLRPSTDPAALEEFVETWQSELIAHPFTTIAVGHGVADGQGTATIVYRFVAAEGADAAAPTIESLLQGETFDGSRSLSAALTVESVEVQDNLVIVTGTQPPATSWNVLHQMVMTGEPPFVLGG